MHGMPQEDFPLKMLIYLGILLEKSLMWMILLNLQRRDGGRTMVMFKYCFCYGRLGHFNKYYEHEVPNVNKDYLYSIAMVGEQVWPPRLTHVATSLNNSTSGGRKRWNSTPKKGQGLPWVLGTPLTKPLPDGASATVISTMTHREILRVDPPCLSVYHLLSHMSPSPSQCQGTKLSSSGRLATYACARGCPNPRRGQQVFSHMAITKSATLVEDSNDIDTTSIDNATLKGVENPIILQGKSGGLCIWLKDGTTIKILFANNFVIDTCIQEKSATTPIHISWFYGPPHNH
ncbi:hypothetical protein ACFX1Z_024773 [Malus domestica]